MLIIIVSNFMAAKCVLNIIFIYILCAIERGRERERVREEIKYHLMNYSTYEIINTITNAFNFYRVSADKKICYSCYIVN